VWGLLLIAVPLQASDYEEGESYTGVKVGLIGSGEVKVSGEIIDQNASFMAGFFFDLPFGSKFHYGLSADFVNMNWQAAGTDRDFKESRGLLDLGINLKGNFVGEDSPVGLRPGVGIGFGVLRGMDDAGIGGSTYLTLKAFAEIVYFTPGDLIFLFDAGVWYAPSGGDNALDIAIGPLVFLRGGVVF